MASETRDRFTPDPASFILPQHQTAPRELSVMLTLSVRGAFKSMQNDYSQINYIKFPASKEQF